MSNNEVHQPAFSELNLPPLILKALEDVGYETPSPIQAATIPYILEGRDILGQAQTGTGKTAAFALPILSNVDLTNNSPQVLILAPTRELAIQVAEACQKYAKHLKGFHVVPIYGGQDYSVQLRALRRGVHVVVGTPGRVMDHIRKGTLILNGLKTLVLDEADEMLRMGFIDDVEWILEKTPESRQIALFSATMPNVIRRIAEKYLNRPEYITIKAKTSTVEAVRQRYWMVSGGHKLDALTRILEAESFDGILIFVRTKNATVELAEKLEARGYAASPLNGDLNQKQRELTVGRLKQGRVDIVVATDVAARGLDVDRISHVINYDVPHDTESYVHRIGRTGRAGRSGEAILFVAPREKRMLYSIEKATKQKIDRLELPTTETINDIRIARFKQRISDTIASEGLEMFQQIMEEYRTEHDVPALEIAAAMAKIVQGDQPLLLQDRPARKSDHAAEGKTRRERPERGEKRNRNADAGERNERSRTNPRQQSAPKHALKPISGMERFRVEVGSGHGVKAGNLVGAICNEVGLESEFIGHIDIHEQHSFIDLPEGMPRSIFTALSQVRVSGEKLDISKAEALASSPTENRRERKFKPSKGGRKPPRHRPK
ncbi:MAG: DEAD/DEAH box helicase [Mariprofundaceae bacterium]